MPANHARLPRWEDRSDGQKLDLLRLLVGDLYALLYQPAVQHLQHLLDRHVPADEHEAQSVAQMRAMLAEHPDLFRPTCEAGHITGSALVLDPAGKRILLTYHAKLRRWLQMGGHAEYEFDPARIALREAREESGLFDLAFFPEPDAGTSAAGAAFLNVNPVDIDVHLIPVRPDTPAHYHLDLRYLVATGTPDNIQMDATESHDLRWFGFDELHAAGADAGLLRLAAKARAALDR